jgi:hypothetical protein
LSALSVKRLWNNETLKDIKNLQKIFANNPHLFVQDFQGIIAEDGQLYQARLVVLSMLLHLQYRWIDSLTLITTPINQVDL